MVNFVTDGLFWVSPGGSCLHWYQDEPEVGRVARSIVEDYVTSPIPVEGSVEFKTDKEYTIAVSTTMDAFLVLLMTKSVVPQDVIYTVAVNVTEYFKTLQVEKPSSWEFPLSLDIPVDLAPWEKYEPVLIDQSRLNGLLAGEVREEAPTPPTTNPVLKSVKGGEAKTPSEGDGDEDKKRVTKEDLVAPSPQPKNNWDIFQKPDKSVYERVHEKAIASMSYIYRIDMKVTTENLSDPLMEISRRLTQKGVGSKTVADVAAMTQARCLGKHFSSWTGAMPLVLHECGAVIRTMLNVNGNIDLVTQATKRKNEGEVFSVAFLGVNGVGKSTSLSKIAYMLSVENELKTLVIACDTFRAGAVEQLKKHASRLGVDVYDQGYGKVASSIAKYGLLKSKTEGYDVALIDTAGRMQGNDPLMREIAKLVDDANPDVVLMVIESSVGNDGEHQLLKFSDTLEQKAGQRKIDGLFLTKFDVVGEKIGLCLTLSHRFKVPVLYVGTGQTYQDIQRLNVDAAARILLHDEK